MPPGKLFVISSSEMEAQSGMKPGKVVMADSHKKQLGWLTPGAVK